MTGDTNAFDRFVEHFRAKIFHYSWLMCGQREDAEDVAQEHIIEGLRELRSTSGAGASSPVGLSDCSKCLLDETAEERFRPGAGTVPGRFLRQ